MLKMLRPIEGPSPGAALDAQFATSKPDRLAALEAISATARRQVERLLQLAPSGLVRMGTRNGVAHTLRRSVDEPGEALFKEGDSLRYAAMTALGVHGLPVDQQRRIFSGKSAAEISVAAAIRAEVAGDAGAVALAAWALAETTGRFAPILFSRLLTRIQSPAALDTVSCAWALTAALAARQLGDTSRLVREAADRLMASQASHGLFPHLTPASANVGLRGGVSCFADQVYPILALSRFAVARGDSDALTAAESCADRICDLQGPAGQWWWHYDMRGGGVAEGYPVYSVHQHAMAPMALMELMEAGRGSYWIEIAIGLDWLDQHPETPEPMIDERREIIWRKVARREPKKASRILSAAVARLRPGSRLPGLDALFPPGQIDYECRPYELGWLLYAWTGEGARSAGHKNGGR